MSAASGCATLPPPSDTNGNCAAEVLESAMATNMPSQVVVTNALQTMENRSDLNSNVFNVACVKISYPDVSADEFCIEDWADELAEKSEQGLHIKNGHVLVVVRIPAVEGELQTLTKLRAKFRVIEFLRLHYPELPKEFTAPCRVLVSEQTDSGDECVVVMSFALKDIVKPEK